MLTLSKYVTQVGISIAVAGANITFFSKRTTTEEKSKEISDKIKSKQIEQDLTK